MLLALPPGLLLRSEMERWRDDPRNVRAGRSPMQVSLRCGGSEGVQREERFESGYGFSVIVLFVAGGRDVLVGPLKCLSRPVEARFSMAASS